MAGVWWNVEMQVVYLLKETGAQTGTVNSDGQVHEVHSVRERFDSPGEAAGGMVKGRCEVGKAIWSGRVVEEDAKDVINEASVEDEVIVKVR